MFTGNYNFFDYKYNIEGYNGQDYGGIAQYLYLIISIILMIILLAILRKSSKEKVLKIIRFFSIFMIILYIVKTTWESIYDIKSGNGFNIGLLPFDTCSIIMLASFLAGFTKGKIKKMAECWITTGGIVGGVATMLFLNAFKYYPFFSFGAFYSMTWHFLMVFLGLLLIVTDYVQMKYITIIYGYIFHLIISAIIIPIDFIYDLDFMMYLKLGGIPIFEDIASNLTKMDLQVLNPFIMLVLYFLAFNIVFVIPLGIKKKKDKKKLFLAVEVTISIILEIFGLMLIINIIDALKHKITSDSTVLIILAIILAIVSITIGSLGIIFFVKRKNMNLNK